MNQHQHQQRNSSKSKIKRPSKKFSPQLRILHNSCGSLANWREATSRWSIGHRPLAHIHRGTQRPSSITRRSVPVAAVSAVHSWLFAFASTIIVGWCGVHPNDKSSGLTRSIHTLIMSSSRICERTM